MYHCGKFKELRQRLQEYIDRYGRSVRVVDVRRKEIDRITGELVTEVLTERGLL